MIPLIIALTNEVKRLQEWEESLKGKENQILLLEHKLESERKEMMVQKFRFMEALQEKSND